MINEDFGIISKVFQEMQNNSNGNYFNEKYVNSSDRNTRRMSTSGFEYPKDLYNSQHQHYFSSIAETKYPTLFQTDMSQFHTMNGDRDKKSEVANQNFFSENNVNLFNRNQQKFQTDCVSDPKYNFIDTNAIPRFSSTPLIAQSSADRNNHNQSHFSDIQMTCGQSFMPNSTFNGQVNSSHTNCQSDNSFRYMQSPYVLYDLRTNSYQNVIMYSSAGPTLNSNDENFDENNGYYHTVGNQPQTNEYEDLVDLASQDPSDMNDNYLKCQLNMAQGNMDTNVFSKYVQDDLMYFLPTELPNDMNRAESQSMPSLHGDDSAESEFDSSEDDQLNTVHGEEMLQELQKLSSVFTNVVNLPMSRSNTVIVDNTDFQGHSNLSRFKKTRIKERTTFWSIDRFLVNDNMVKIIPNEVANIRPMDIERLDKFEADIFGYTSFNEKDYQDVSSSPPHCIHSSFRCPSAPIDVRFLKHSNRASQKYRSSYNSHSPIDQMSANLQSRHSHRKSLQIPVRIPFGWNPIIPLVSPAVKHRNRMLFESTNICNGKNSRRKRRWSVSGTKLEKNCSTHCLRSHNQRPPCDPANHVKYDLAQEYFDNRHSFDLRDLEENSGDGNSQISANLESKLDSHLTALKRTVMSYMECNMSDIRDEVRSLRGTHITLEKQLKYYKEKVQILENSVRENLPREQWDLYGVVSDSSSSAR